MRARASSWVRRLRENADLLLSLSLFVSFFLLYARTVTPGVLDADGGEFQTNIYRLGVSHTGYPLYFLLAKTWTVFFPFGSVAFRANMFSVLLGAAAIALLYPALRFLVRSRVAALAAAVLFGVSRVEWSQALIPDVYTLNSFLIVLVIFTAALWRTGAVRLEYLLFAYGLSLAHHRTMIWFGPALLLWVLMGEGKALFHPARLARLAPAFLIPLLLYLYVPLRGESDVGVEYHARNLTEMILATNVSISLKYGPPGFLWERISTVYLPLLVEQFTLPGFVLGLVGAVGLAAGRVPRGWPAGLPSRPWLVFILIAHFCETAFGIVFWVVDSEIFFIPSYLTFLFLVGVGIAFAWDWLTALVAQRPRVAAVQLAAPSFMLGLAIVALWLAMSNYTRVDRSWDDEADLRWQEILSRPLEPHAWIVGNWESITPLEYYQYVEGRRTDLRRQKVVIFKDQLPLALPQGSLVKQLATRLDRGDAVYFTLSPDAAETLSDVAAAFQAVPEGKLWRLQRPASIAIQRLDAQFGDSLALDSAGSSPASPEPGEGITVQLNWAPPGREPDRYALTLTLKDTSGYVWSEEQAPQPAAQAAGETRTTGITTERLGMHIPPDAPPGPYSISLAVRDATGALLKTDNADALKLARLDVVATSHPWPAESYELENRVALVTPLGRVIGWRLADPQPRAGDEVELDTWWEQASNGRVELVLRDSAGTDYIVDKGDLFSGSGAPGPGQIFRAHQSVLVPPRAAPGPASFDVVIGGQRFHLASLTLQASVRLFDAPALQYAQRAILGDAIELVGYNLDRTQARAGEAVRLTLGWHAATKIDRSYKVFAHLLAPDGTLVAQQDAYPHQGALTTDRWLPGEYVLDEYRLVLPPGSAAGDYHIEIGMYTEPDGIRLEARDTNGQPLEGNRVLLTVPIQVQR